MDIRALVGRNVARLRKERSLRQETLSEMTGITQAYLSQIENGQINLTLLSIHELAQAFEVAPRELFDEPATE